MNFQALNIVFMYTDLSKSDDHNLLILSQGIELFSWIQYWQSLALCLGFLYFRIYVCISQSILGLWFWKFWIHVSVLILLYWIRSQSFTFTVLVSKSLRYLRSDGFKSLFWQVGKENGRGGCGPFWNVGAAGFMREF